MALQSSRTSEYLCLLHVDDELPPETVTQLFYLVVAYAINYQQSKQTIIHKDDYLLKYSWIVSIIIISKINNSILHLQPQHPRYPPTQDAVRKVLGISRLREEVWSRKKMMSSWHSVSLKRTFTEIADFHQHSTSPAFTWTIIRLCKVKVLIFRSIPIFFQFQPVWIWISNYSGLHSG